MRLKLTLQVRRIATVHHRRRGRKPQPAHSSSKSRERRPRSRLPVNSMVQQVNAFASEVTRVALEVGTMGVLGGQAQVEGVQGNLGPINNVQQNGLELPHWSVPSPNAVASRDLQQTVPSRGPRRDAGPREHRQIHGPTTVHHDEPSDASELLEAGIEAKLDGASCGRGCGGNVEGLDK
ncbi:hypothetical protein FRC05_005814 [Tulasnella sp. 425]|nr:hypothetical protein FRC05_005814 [Tulasnella sp. 425]